MGLIAVAIMAWFLFVFMPTWPVWAIVVFWVALLGFFPLASWWAGD